MNSGRQTIVCALMLVVLPRASCLGQETSSGQWTISTIYSAGARDLAASSKINNVLLRKDGREAITCTENGEVCVWDTNAGDAKVLRRYFSSEIETAWCIALAADERKLAIGGKGTAIHVLDAESGNLTDQLAWESTVYAMGFLPDGKTLLFADSDGVVALWPPGAETVSGQWDLGNDSITALHVASDGESFVTGDRDGNVALWRFPDLENVKADEKPEPVLEFVGLENTVCCLRFSPDQTRVAGVDYSGRIVLWTVQSGKQLWLESKEVDEACWVEFFDNERMAVVTGDGQLLLFECQNGGFRNHEIPMPDLAGFTLSRDGSLIWFGGNTIPFGWDSESGRLAYPPEDKIPFAHALQDVDFAPDNQSLIFTGVKQRPFRLNVATGIIESFSEEEIGPELESGAKTIVTRERLIRHNTELAYLFDWSGKQTEKAHSESGLVIAGPGKTSAVILRSDAQGNYRIAPLSSSNPGGEGQEEAANLSEGSAGWLSDNHLALLMNSRTLSIIDVNTGGEVKSTDLQDVIGILDTVNGGLAIGRRTGLPAIYCTHIETSLAAGEDEIHKWYRELDDDDFQTRENAMHSLAGQGREVIDRLPSQFGASAEQKVRLQRLGQLVSSRWLPDLSGEMRWIDTDIESVDCLCFDSALRFLLVGTFRESRPELRVYTLLGGEVRLVASFPLQLRAKALRRAWDDPDLFAVVYATGIADVFRIGTPQPAQTPATR